MPAEPNALVRAFLDAANRQDAFAMATVFRMDAINQGQRVGREGMRRLFKSLFSVFPDWHYDPHEIVGEARLVMCRVTMTGTHRGTPTAPILGGLLIGVPPTGRMVKVQQMHFYSIVEGEILEYRTVRDDLGMMQQLGLLRTTIAP